MNHIFGETLDIYIFPPQVIYGQHFKRFQRNLRKFWKIGSTYFLSKSSVNQNESFSTFPFPHFHVFSLYSQFTHSVKDFLKKSSMVVDFMNVLFRNIFPSKYLLPQIIIKETREFYV